VAAGTTTFCAHLFKHGFDLEQSLGLSLVNTLGAFGFRRDFVAPWVTRDLLPLMLIAGAQTVFGPALPLQP
jgi:hypothetical protein